MMRAYYFEENKEWDEDVHLLLFAVRESVHEALGFSLLNWYLGMYQGDPSSF